jgi:hypothetical protein
MFEAIYINRDQAFEFDNGQDLYFGPVGTWFSVRADALLRSRPGGYDKTHTEILKSYGTENILLVRTQSCGPGWYQIHPNER